ncbi:MAG: glycosyltransferase family 2 protein [Pedobacter sp.]|nr:MAG: glycosyltransferase family 2 protein [Pedobacter sp.]
MSHKSIEKVAVVIPNYNGADFLALAIDSLLSQTYPCTVIVVENGSSDTSRKIIETYGPKIFPVYNEINLGFAGGVNTGIRHALDKDYDAIALFNNDAVANVDWLENLVQRMMLHDEVGIVTSKIQLADKKTLDSTGEFYTTWGLPYPRGRGQNLTTYKMSEYIFGASGGASLYRSSLFDDVGIFDEKFFAYYEDTDISFRAQLAGWKVFYEEKAIVNHRQGATSKRMVKGFAVHQTFKNLPMLFWKNVPVGLLLPVGTRFFIAYTLILGNAISRGNTKMAVTGLLKSLSLIPHTVKQRRHIQSTKKVSSSYINSIIIHDLPPDQDGIRKLRKFFLKR